MLICVFRVGTDKRADGPRSGAECRRRTGSAHAHRGRSPAHKRSARARDNAVSTGSISYRACLSQAGSGELYGYFAHDGGSECLP